MWIALSNTQPFDYQIDCLQYAVENKPVIFPPRLICKCYAGCRLCHAGLVPLHSGMAAHPQKSPLADLRRRMGWPHSGQAGGGGIVYPRASMRLAMSRSLKPPVSSKALPCASVWLLSMFRIHLVDNTKISDNQIIPGQPSPLRHFGQSGQFVICLVADGAAT